MESVEHQRQQLQGELVEANNLLAQAKGSRLVACLRGLVGELEGDIEALRSADKANRDTASTATQGPTDMDATVDGTESSSGSPAGDSVGEGASDIDIPANTPSKNQSPPPAARSAPSATVASPPRIPASSVRAAPPTVGSYQGVDSFAWEQGEYNSPWVTVYVTIPGVGAAKDRVKCDFTKNSFDLKVENVGGRNYRLLKDNLDKDIVVAESKIIVKKDKVIVKLKKVKGEYSYDHWTDLVAKRKRTDEDSKDPSAGLMDVMKDLYDSGDDNMRKMIGETMLKSKMGIKSDPPSYESSFDKSMSSPMSSDFSMPPGLDDDFGGL